MRHVIIASHHRFADGLKDTLEFIGGVQNMRAVCAYVADTPGFASFDMEQLPPIPKEELQHCFPEFEPYIGRCRFDDCAHLKEPGCAVREAMDEGKINPSRHESYARLYEVSAKYREWEK